MPRLAKLATSVIAAAMLAGCTVGPNYQPPKINVPDHFTEAPATALAIQWWHNFKDPQLDSLIDRATRGNLDLKLATSRIQAARAQYGITAAGAFPFLNANGAATYRHSPTSGLGGNSGIETESYSTGLDASWEIDVFGSVRRG